MVSTIKVSARIQAGLGVLGLCGIFFSADAMARNSYCCNDAHGKLACGDVLPAACQGRPYRIRDEKGVTLREVGPPLTPEQRKLREAEKVRQAEEEKRLAEEKRRDAAMLASYPTENDIEVARERALAEFDKASAESQKRFDDATKRKKKLDAEKEFYVKSPMPANVKKQIEENATEIKSMQEVLDKRKVERTEISGKFEADKKRYMELRYGKGAGAAKAADMRPR